MVIVGWIALPLGCGRKAVGAVIDRFGPYGPALAPGVTVQESDQPAITDDHGSFLRWQNEKIRLDECSF